MLQGSLGQRVQCPVFLAQFDSASTNLCSYVLMHISTRNQIPGQSTSHPSKMTVYDATLRAAFEPPSYADLATKEPQKPRSHKNHVSDRFVPLNTDVDVTLLGSYHTTPSKSAFKTARLSWFTHTTWDIEPIIHDGARKACKGQRSVGACEFQ